MGKSLLRDQLNIKMQAFLPVQTAVSGPVGWIQSTRKALGMTLEQLANKLGISKQSAKETELRELAGAITLKTLRDIAETMDMQLVYGFVPKDGSLDALIERKATELARQIVMRTSNTMKLENQQNSAERIAKAIKERAEIIMAENPKMLWD
ncbi:MAG: mobile mystery protein A [Bacteroidota bacterium]